MSMDCLSIRIIDVEGLGADDVLGNFSSRQKMDAVDVNETVERILNEVYEKGDEALYHFTEIFDAVDLRAAGFRIAKETVNEALLSLDPTLRQALEEAAEKITYFHRQQLDQEQDMLLDDGGGRRTALLKRPLDTVGLYVPGGLAPLPSSVLMNAIPAKTAGVRRLVMATPPGVDGQVPAVILAAAAIAGVDEVYRVGGAQAIAAMAYGTEQIPRVDKIVGPGNIYVNTAKRKVFGRVDIDLFAGPSEILVIADEASDPSFVAADLLSQAEHDPLASAMLLTPSRSLAEAVQLEIRSLIEDHPRRSIIQASLEDYGAILLVKDLDQAIEWANRLAPEHLELCIDAQRARQLLPKILNAGAVFIGAYSPEPLGDYWAGPNHVLPTSGSARFFSPLSTADFIKHMSVVDYEAEALLADASSIISLAEAEGLYSHAAAIQIRVDRARAEGYADGRLDVPGTAG